MFGGRYSAFTAAPYEINFEALLMLAVSLRSIRKSFASSGRILRLAAESRYLRSVRFLAQRASESECVFRFSLLPSFSFFLDVVASATCPTISRSSDGGSRRRRLAVDPELPTALTKTPFSLHALSISTTLVQTDRYVPSTPCVNSHRLPLQAGKKSEPFLPPVA